MTYLWQLWYWVVGCEDTLSANTIRWCRLNGKKYTDIKLEDTLYADLGGLVYRGSSDTYRGRCSTHTH